MLRHAVRLVVSASLSLLFSLPPALAVDQVTARRGGVAIGGDNTGTITVGLTPVEVRALVDQILGEAGVDSDKIVELSTRFGVTDGAVRTFLRTLGEAQVPIEALPETLGRIAERHKDLLAQIEQLRSASPDVQAIKDQAAAAVEAGAYDRAEALLAEAEAAALADANRLLLEAASLRAERGNLAMTRLHYRAAAEHFSAAADTVPHSDPLTRADYLNHAASAAFQGAAYALAEKAWKGSAHEP
jgi:hypothetical protein